CTARTISHRSDRTSCASLCSTGLRSSLVAPPEMSQLSISFNQLFERPRLNHFAVVEYVNDVEQFQQMQLVHRGNQASVAEPRKHVVVDGALIGGVDTAGRLVQQQNVAIPGEEDSARESQSLFLAAAQIDAFLGDIGVETLRQSGQNFFESGRFDS